MAVIHALPGMGGDHRMYQGAWNALPNFVTHDWPEYKGEKSLAEVAASACVVWDVKDGDIFVGSSLGGMVACEILKIKNIPMLFLVGSAMSPREINQILSVLHALSGVALLKMLQQLAGHISNEAIQMFADADTNFMHAMSKAIFEWQGLELTETIVHRIHGRHDFVIPLREKVDMVVDGGHLIAMTNAEECVSHISKHVR